LTSKFGVHCHFTLSPNRIADEIGIPSVLETKAKKELIWAVFPVRSEAPAVGGYISSAYTDHNQFRDIKKDFS
jgi:hypothetical protein